MTDPPPSQGAQGETFFSTTTAATTRQTYPEDEICCDDVSFLRILRSMKKGRAGGEDGLAAEFVQAMTPMHIGALLQLVPDTLAGRRAIPAGWRAGHVALIPKVVMACRPGDYRPITVLPVALKITMKVWLHHASEFLTLRRQPSHGFRSSFQPAEVHHILRTLIRKHSEWGESLTLCKVDIAKAYDSVTWKAIDEMFRERQLPNALREAYWKIHMGRKLQFSANSGTLRFSIEPTRGLPQGAPESPLIYAAVMEGVIERTENRLKHSGRPAGVRIQWEEHPARVEESRQELQTCSDPESIAYINFADDTCILARTAVMLEFELAVLQSEFRAVGQTLNMKKSEVLTRDAEEESVSPPRSWSDEELGAYEARGAEAPNTSTSPIGRSSHAVTRAMTVLGSEISFNPSQPEALPARLKRVWHKSSLIRAQLQMRVAPIRARVQLLDAANLPTMLYGMETVHSSTVMRRKVDATQRTLIGRLLLVLRRPTKDLQAYFRRRERLITTTIAKYARGTSSQL